MGITFNIFAGLALLVVMSVPAFPLSCYKCVSNSSLCGDEIKGGMIPPPGTKTTCPKGTNTCLELILGDKYGRGCSDIGCPPESTPALKYCRDCKTDFCNTMKIPADDSPGTNGSSNSADTVQHGVPILMAIPMLVKMLIF